MHYDAIVIGCGGMGSAALRALALKGKRVLGIEQFELAMIVGQVTAIRELFAWPITSILIMFRCCGGRSSCGPTSRSKPVSGCSLKRRAGYWADGWASGHGSPGSLSYA